MAKVLGAWPRLWVLGQGRGGVAKAVGACLNQYLTLTLMPWGHTQGHGGMVKPVGARPRPWGRGQGRGGVTKAVGARSRQWSFFHKP